MKDKVSLTQHGRFLPNAVQIGPPELARLVTDHLIGSLFLPQGSDLSFELIMEPNSCCYDPINKNHFYSRFFPLLATAIGSALH